MNKDIGISCYQEDSNTITQNLNAQHKLHIKRILDILFQTRGKEIGKRNTIKDRISFRKCT